MHSDVSCEGFNVDILCSKQMTLRKNFHLKNIVSFDTKLSLATLGK